MVDVVTRLSPRRRKSPLIVGLDWTDVHKSPLIVGLDWTDVHDFQALLEVACIGGRAVPLLWASYPGSKLRRSQNALDDCLLRWHRARTPPSCPVTILSGRGFARAEWAACQELVFRDVVQFRPDVTATCPRHRSVLRRYPTREDMAHAHRGSATARLGT